MTAWGKLITSLCLATLCGQSAVAAGPAKPPPLPPLHTDRVTLTSIDAPGGSATALFGFWFKGKGKAEKKPTIIAMHGCGGLYSSFNKARIEFTPRHIAMARILTDAGYNVLFPDSFTPRGRRSICQESTQQRELSSARRRIDVQVALRWLATQDDVDYARIGMIGWSHGATTILSALNLAQTDVAIRKVQPKAAIAFYPACSAYARNRTPYKPAAPMLILMGQNDDWTPPEACENLEKKMQDSDTPITLKLFPDTFHEFDAPGMPSHVRMDIPGAGKPGLGVTVAGNADARAEAYREMLKFLKDKLD